MRPLLIALTLTFTMVLAAEASAQSLADLARQEKERRAKVTDETKVITNNDRPKGAGETATAEAEPAPEKKGDKGIDVADGKAKADKKADDEPKDLFGRTESFWRQTFSDARKRVKDLEEESRVLQLKINDLQNKFYSESNGYKQQDIQREIQKCFYEQDVNKQNLAKARNELQQLEVEARKSGALPGWIDGRSTP
jgi:hypothetical protein